MENKTLFKVVNLQKYFPLKKKLFSKKQDFVHANETITLNIKEGETFGLVGESGSGKSTFGRTLLQLYTQTGGSILYYGTTLNEMAPRYMKKIINSIPKKFPEYDKKVEEFYKAKENFEKEEDEVKKSEHQVEMIEKRKDLEENYINMLRIAGGLLTSDNLEEVKNALLSYYDVLKEKADVNLKIKKIKEEAFVKGIKSPEELKNNDDLNLKSLEKELEIKEKSVKVERDKIEELRNSLRMKDNFENYESFKDDGIDLSELDNSEIRELRKDLQIIFQDPYGSLDTRMTVGNIIGEGVLGHKLFSSRKEEGYNEYIQAVMKECGLDPYFIHRYPHQFSGGQRQRIGIARALALRPKFIVCDEAVSALDVSIQSQVINLLQDMKEQFNLTYLFITHDLSVVKYISDRIGVMYLGVLVELSSSDKIFKNPIHPYTKALLEAIPRTDVPHGQTLQVIEGDIPSAVNPPKGCRFHTRCKYCMEICKNVIPEFKEIEKDHFVACFLTDVSEEEKEKAYRDNLKLKEKEN